MEEQTFDASVSSFLDSLASGTPTPGGGGAAALGGAMGAALISMVCNLTVGKARFADVETEMRDILDRAEALRHELQELGDADVVAFKRLSAAYKLPRTTDADIAIRRDAIQASLRRATEVPLRTAYAAAAILPLCAPVADRGNQAAVSDVGVGAMFAHTAVRSSLLNVEINLRLLEDRMFIRQVRDEVERLTDGLDTEAARVQELVVSRVKP